MEPITVRMNEVNISTKEQPIIGTDSLGPCVGVLIHSKKHKRSVVFHTSTDWQTLVVESLVILVENFMISSENFHKALEILEVYQKYDLYNLNYLTKQEIFTKNSLNITDCSDEEMLEVIIVPGYYKDHYNIANNMTKYFSSLYPSMEVRTTSLPDNSIATRMFDDIGSHEFFFDSRSGRFVTEKISEYRNSNSYRV